MTRKPIGALFVFAVCLLTASCTRLDSSKPKVLGPLSFEPAKFADAIPDEYGTLIGVTQNAQTPGWVSLWFQKSDRSITAVFVNIEEGKIYEKALTIPRK